jgi:hypothetical protein
VIRSFCGRSHKHGYRCCVVSRYTIPNTLDNQAPSS